MPNNSDAKSSTDSVEVQTRRNWWHKAKDFIIRNCSMYDMGDTKYRIKANVVFIGNRPERSTPSTSHADQGEAQETDQQTPLPNILPQASVQANSNLSALAPDHNNAFESEAKSDCTNPDVPSNSSEAYASTTRGQSHIYSLEMLILEAGYPLYMPTPSGGLPTAYLRKGVRIGDVGLVTANGAFDFLFNTCQYDDPSDAGVNPSILPDGFEFLKPITRVNGRFDPGICLTSHHVSEIRDHTSLSAFQCSAKGAILALPAGATVYEAMNVRHFQAHAARHAARWYKYALNECGRDISNGSLYLVTECTKSTNWGISVFYGNTKANNDRHLMFDKGSCRWEIYRDKVDARVGPKPRDIIHSDNDEPNQCVFLRGIKIMLRPDIWDGLNGIIDVRCQDGESSDPPFTRTTRSSSHQISGGQTNSFHQNPSGDRNASGPSHNVRLNAEKPLQMQAPQSIPFEVVNPPCEPNRQGPWLEKVILEDIFRATTPLHPSDPINVMLLHLKPEAGVALVHDSVWSDQLPHDFMEDPLNPNIEGLLKNVMRSYMAMIDEHASVVLINRIELDSKSQNDFDGSLPIIASQNDENILMDNATEPSLPVVHLSDLLQSLPGPLPRIPFETSDGNALICNVGLRHQHQQPRRIETSNSPGFTSPPVALTALHHHGMGMPAYPDAGDYLRHQFGLSPSEPVNLDCLPDPPAGHKPLQPLSVLIKLAIYGSPQKKLTLKGIYEAIENRFEYFRNDSSGAWKRSIRHHLSLNQVFRNTPKPITELGKGSYWELDITRGEAYKRRNKKARPQAQAAPDQESESESASDEEFGSDTSSITAGEIPDWDVASTAADKADS